MEKNHMIRVLKKTRSAIESKDYIEIKNLSNQMVHTSSVDQDPDVISVAVIIYSLSKLVEREKYKEYRGWQNFFRDYKTLLNNSIKDLEKNNIREFREDINEIRSLIENLSGHLRNYLTEVFRKAQINKASRIYEHGISMEQTAKILGISVWELAEYAGQTGIADVDLSITLPIKERIKAVEEIFKR
jgi:predicted RNA-binding protein